MFLLYFLLLLVPLVLFHEFGHFIVARWMGVRVLSFSVGFGPTVLRWQRGHTEYAVRALPLGGFVRMLGDDPSAPIDPLIARDPEAFTSKPVWKRALIVAAGPIANFILPIFILFFGALLLDGQVVSSRLGTVLPEGPAAQAGLRAGDRIVEVDGAAVATFDDLRRAIAERPGRRTPVVYERDGQRRTTELKPVARRDVQVAELGLADIVGRIEVRPDAQAAIVAVAPGSPAWRAGLRSGERILKVDGQETRRYYELERALHAAARKGQPVRLEVASLRLEAPVAREALQASFEQPHAKTTRQVTLPLAGVADAEGLGLQAAQLVVGPVEKGSPVDVQTGLLPGDEIVRLDGTPTRSFLHLYDVLTKPYDDVRLDPAHRGAAPEDLLAEIKKALARPHTVVVRHAFRPAELERLQAVVAGRAQPATPTEKAVAAAPDPAGVLTQGYVEREARLQIGVTLGKDDRPSLQFGANPLQAYEDPEQIANPDPFGHAVRHTGEEMGRALHVTVLTVAGLFRGHVPVKEVGGPIFMAQLASKTAELGWGFFFQLMVWISINLAILNLLPIPLVDGGHLLFLAIEAIKREPVSLRTRQMAAYVGMAFLGILFIVVMKNDVQKLFH